MIKELVENKLRDQSISMRQAAREIGVAHTTIFRILEGRPVDLKTVKKIADWLGVEASSLEDAGSDELASKNAVFIEREPELARQLDNAMRRLSEGRMKPETLRDVLAYCED